MAFTPKDWKDYPDTSTPITAAALEDLETRVTAYAVPTGSLTAYAGTTAPTGWLLCDGAAVSRSTYADLFTLLSTNFGSGNGSTTFNVPDLRGRVPVGLDNLGGSDASRLSVSNTLGGSGGEQTHTLTTSEMPSHAHNMESVSLGGSGPSLVTSNGKSYVRGSATTTGTDTSLGPAITNGSFSWGLGVEESGGGGAHENMQPYLLLGYIIKT